MLEAKNILFFCIFLGWSLTLAGTYRDNMAPDVEMKLSFPKKTINNGDDLDSSKSQEKEKYLNNNMGNLYQRQSSDISNENLNTNRAALPPPPPPTQQQQPTPGSQNLNPKRTLSKVTPGKC